MNFLLSVLSYSFQQEGKVMINWKRNLFFVWLSQILSLAGFGSVIPFIPLYMRNVLGVMDDGERGLWVSTFYFGGQLCFCISMPVWGTLADRFGRRVMLLRANLVTALLFPLMAYVPGVGWLVAIRAVMSIFSGTVNAAQTLIGSTTPEEHQGFALGALSSALWSGNMIGYMAGGLVVDRFGYTPAFFSGGGMLLAAGLIVLFFVKDDFVPRPVSLPGVKTAKEPFSLRKLFPDFGRVIWTLLFLFVFLGFVRKFDDPFIAIQVELIHGSDSAAFWTGIICAGAAISGVFSGIVLGWLCDRFSPERIAIPATLLSGLLMIPQGLAANLWVFGGARFLNYFFAGGLDPVFLTIMSRVTPQEKRGSVFGWGASAKVGGSLFSSLLGGFIIYHFGVRWIFYIGGILMLCLIPLIGTLPREVLNSGKNK